jgi:DNA-binding MarR family transcriptional regulator
MAMKITPMELLVLRGIVDSEYQESDEIVDTPVYAWSATGAIPPSSAGGVVASLVKKGLAETYQDGQEDLLSITAAGLAAVEEA